VRNAIAVLTFAAVSAFAQQAAPPPLAQRIDVTVVNVDVTVFDRHGNAVGGLTKDDFEIYEDNVLQSITNFSARSEDVSQSETQPVIAAEERPEEHRRSVVILIDRSSFFRGAVRTNVKYGLDRLLAESAEGTRWSVVTLQDGMKTELPFTTDKDEVRNAIEAVRRGVRLPKRGALPVVAEQINLGSTFGLPDPDCPSGTCVVKAFKTGVEAAEQFGTDMNFYGAVIETSRGLAWVPGNKAILVVSSYVPGYVSPSMGEYAIQQALLHEAMVREANAAGAKIYVIDPLGVTGSLEMGRSSSGAGTRNVGAAVWLASLTGGMYLPGNRMDLSVRRFDAATTHYYEIGYHAAADDGKYHRINVRLKKPGRYTVNYRKGYFRLTKEAAFEQALLTPFGIASQKATLPITLTIDDPRPQKNGKSIVPLTTTIPLDRAMYLGTTGRLHLYVSVFTASGNPIGFRHYVETITEKTDARLVVSHDVELKKGTYRLFVTVRDELSDAVGVVAKEIGL
jgi:VWFA-related protein